MLYCQFLETGTTLFNTGRVEFPWRLRYQPEQGRLQVSPTEGTLPAGAAQRIAIHFLPMIPEYFERQIELEVTHFPPEVITVLGHGAYPAVMLDLPLQYEDICELTFLEAVQNIAAVMEQERTEPSEQSSSSSERMLCVKNAAGSAAPEHADAPTTVLFDQQQSQQPGQGPPPAGGQQPAADRPAVAADPSDQPAPPQPGSVAALDPAAGAAGETAPPDAAAAPPELPAADLSTAGSPRSAIAGEPLSPFPAPADPAPATDPAEEAALPELDPEEQEEEEQGAGGEEQEADQETESPVSSSWSVITHEDPAMVDAALIDLEVERLMTVNFIRNHPTTASFLRGGTSRRNAVCMDLLKYHLDFGLVLLGSDLHRAITVTNISQLPVSLSLITAVPAALADDELRVSLEDEVGALQPGDSTFIHLRLRPSSLEGPVETMQRMIYLEVKFGLFIPILLKATVTAPIAELDEGELGFGTVYVGQCKVCQLKVHNNGILPAAWSLVARPPDRPAALPFSSGERPRRRPAAVAQPPVFAFEPSGGLLQPDQWAVINVIFAPAKSKVYVMEAALSVQGSSQTWLKRMTGEGLDSSLDFSTTELAFEPIVPYNEGGRMEVTIFNKHPIPLEIFSIEFDRQYLEEEHVLRTLTTYDEFDQLIVPPRRPGEPLWPEVRAFYTELVHRAAQPGRPADESAAASSHVSLDVALPGAGRSRSQLALRTPDLHSAGGGGGGGGGGPAPPVPAAPSLLPLPAPQPALQPGQAPGLPAIAVSPSPSRQLAGPGPEPPVGCGSGSDAALHSWPGWAGVLDQPAMWTLPAQEQFIRDYHELCVSGAGAAVADPIAQAIVSYINSDQPADHYLNLSRRAPAFVIISAPYTGEYSKPYLLAVLVAERYGLSVVTVDQLVWECLLTPSSAAAHRARDFLFDSGKQGGRGAPPAAKQPANSKRGQTTAAGQTRAGRKRSESDSSVPAPGLRDVLKPRPLPPAMLGELIALRLTEPDVSSGVVFWDVHNCQFSANVTHTVMALLLGLGKRKHAYFITMNRSAAQQIELLRKQKATEDQAESRPVYTPPPEATLLACDEIEYEALPERDRTRLALLMRRTRQKRAKERRDEVRRLQEQLRQEHEKKSRKGKGSALHKQLSHHNKISSPDQADPRKSSMRKPSAMSRMSLRQPRSDVSIEPHDRKKRGASKKKGDEDLVLDERQIEEEKLITAQFKAFHDTLATLVCLLDIVDRDRLVPEGMPAEDSLKFGATQHKRSSKGRSQRAGKNSTLSKVCSLFPHISSEWRNAWVV
ncbi:Hydrocephalus-inducing [Amphibalanus amphitrite]|uniref:Hydrocephalus-inducing n=1 Tax=Amphibalanus amphitrite TaxID=1232801 RepID=A0A6A4VTX4_AMPAM|nr:Hydrocephalus-inducing [Amphibalanus amphitrite]